MPDETRNSSGRDMWIGLGVFVGCLALLAVMAFHLNHLLTGLSRLHVPQIVQGLIAPVLALLPGILFVGTIVWATRHGHPRVFHGFAIGVAITGVTLLVMMLSTCFKMFGGGH